MQNRSFSDEEVANVIGYLTGQQWSGEAKLWWNLCRIVQDKLMIMLDPKQPLKEIVPKSKVNEVIKSIYNNPETGGTGRDPLFNRIYSKYAGISKRQVMEWLRNQESWQLLTKPAPVPSQTKSIISTHVNARWQMDLMDFSSTPANGYNWIFGVIDMFSKFAWAIPIKNKEASTIVAKLEPLIQMYKPELIQSDNGSEFKNKQVSELLKKYNVKQIFSKAHSPTSQGCIERWNGSVKKILNVMMNRLNTKNWAELLSGVVENYNNNKHSTTGYPPSRAFTDRTLQPTILKRIQAKAIKFHNPPQFALGNKVRVRMKALQEFKRNKLIKPPTVWTTQLFTVVSIINPTDEFSVPRYVVRSGIQNESFSPWDLQLVNTTTLIPSAPQPINQNASIFDQQPKSVQKANSTTNPSKQNEPKRSSKNQVVRQSSRAPKYNKQLDDYVAYDKR